jgi:hypothetical protein
LEAYVGLSEPVLGAFAAGIMFTQPFCFLPLRWRNDPKALGLAIFAAMTPPFLFSEALLFRLGSEDLGYLSLLLDDHVATLGHAKGIFQQPKMVELGARGMLERLEP